MPSCSEDKHRLWMWGVWLEQTSLFHFYCIVPSDPCPCQELLVVSGLLPALGLCFCPLRVSHHEGPRKKAHDRLLGLSISSNLTTQHSHCVAINIPSKLKPSLLGGGERFLQLSRGLGNLETYESNKALAQDSMSRGQEAGKDCLLQSCLQGALTYAGKVLWPFSCL